MAYTTLRRALFHHNPWMLPPIPPQKPQVEELKLSGCICDHSPPRLLKNHDFTFSPIFLPRHKKSFHPTWLSQNPTKINSFCNQTFDTSFWMHLWEFPTKIAKKPWLHFFTNFATQAQKPNPPNLAKPKPNQDQFFFATKLFTPHFAYICDNSPPRLFKNHDFTFSTILLPKHKKLVHPTWLSQNPTKINSFCNQTFHTSFCIHLWHFPTKIA